MEQDQFRDDTPENDRHSIMKHFRFIRGNNASGSIRAATLAVIVLGAIVTAAVSLILEDVLPKSDPGELFVVSRWVFLGASLLLVTLAVWLRYEVRNYSGTLFSVQALDEGATDRLNDGGMDSRLAANHRYMQLRSIHRWVDYEQFLDRGVIDVHGLVREIGAVLEILINTSADEDRQTVAPNMPWPMAMAVGAYLPARQFNMHVLELPGRRSDTGHEFPLRYSEDENTVPNTTKKHHLSEEPGTRIGAFLILDDRVTQTDLGIFHPFAVTTVYTVEVSSSSADAGPSRYVEPELETCARLFAEQLATIKETHPDEELVIAADISAAVALSLGWHLTQYALRLYRHTHLLYLEGARPVPMRVRPAQPASCEA